MLRTMVIGSINMDMVTRAPRFPAPGETLTGESFSTVPGGKGANQAVALGRLGAQPRMAGCVGDDGFGAEYLRVFRDNGVDASLVSTVSGSTGVAAIQVAESGENTIIVVPGANAACDDKWLDDVLARAEECDLFLLQLEIDPAVAFRAAKALHAMGKTVILDPAPAREIPRDVLGCIDYITPNETELRIVTSFLPESAGSEERMQALLDAGTRCVVHKAGSDGAYVLDQSGLSHIPAFKVKAVDTTAAGDTFNAGLAFGLAQGLPIREAARLASAAGAMAVTKPGAQGGMPTQDELIAFMEK